MDAPLRISLVLPAFNEAAVIGRAISEAEAALAGRFSAFEIVVVDDGSTDGTADEVQSLSAPHTRLLRHATNRGYGAALRTGFEAARFPLVAFTDADCQFDLTELADLAALTADHDIAAGYRADRKDPWRRRFLSRGYNLLTRTLLGTRVRDVDCALKVFRRAALAHLLPESRGFFVNTEMLTRARRLGFTVTERPVTHRPRAGGDSKVSLWEVPRTFRTLVSFWWSEVVWGARPAAAVTQTRVTVPEPAPVRRPASEVPRPAAPRGRRQEAA
ncbi:MAG: glycosyltransferase family 2 protein [Gemmataceae bacterium]